MVLPGFNTDFKHEGRIYHAQTEDNGVDNPYVVTLLYLRGAILASKKTSYKDLLEKDHFQQHLMKLMKDQHRGIMKDVLSGKYVSEAEPGSDDMKAAEASVAITAPPAAAEAKSLDEAIMEFLDSYASGEGQST